MDPVDELAKPVRTSGYYEGWRWDNKEPFLVAVAKHCDVELVILGTEGLLIKRTYFTARGTQANIETFERALKRMPR